MREDPKLAQVLELAAEGLGRRAIARRTGLPASTVHYWMNTPEVMPRHALARPREWHPPDAETYAYALGLYLGDGHIQVRSERSAFLTLKLDHKYRDLVGEAAAALRLVFPGSRVSQYDRPSLGETVLQLSDSALPVAFPQHGPGAKHDRPIELADWQREITRSDPQPLIRGLIHSDGCRTVNRFSTRLPSGRVKQYEYVRYFFTNVSADIRRIFVEHCELLGIRCTQSNARNISVAHRPSVELLDTFVGPKR